MQIFGLQLPLPWDPTVIIFQKYADPSFFPSQSFGGFVDSTPPRDDHTMIIRKPIDPRSPREISFENITQTPVNHWKFKWERYMEDEENFCLNSFGIL